MRKLLVGLALAGAALAPVKASAAQQPESEAPSLELSFSRASGRPGDEVKLPIYVNSDSEVRQPFKIVLRFSPEQVTYKQFETGLLARKAGWTLQPQPKEASKDQKLASLEIEVQPGNSEFFPNGVIAYARFAIAKTAPVGDIPLEASLEPIGSAPLKLKAEPAKITVYTEAVYGCFFYMH